MLSSQDYVSHGGNNCPHCNSTDIEGGSFETDDFGAWRKVECNECGSTWEDIYNLVKFDNFEEGD